METAVMGALSLCALQDLKKKEVTYRSLALTALAVLSSLVIRQQTDFINMLGGAAIGLGMLILGKLTGEIGAADGVLLMATGVFFGWKKNLALLFLALLFSAVAAVILLVFFKKDRKFELPFVPFLCLAFAVVQWG
ncbi:MAG: prepilin peptidase [Lachnospiraceae bacterium]